MITIFSHPLGLNRGHRPDAPNLQQTDASAHASATRSAKSSLHASSTPSGRTITRSGDSASTAPSSCVTSTIAPRKPRNAPRTSSRLAGSRLFVGSSSNRTFAPDTTRRARASLVFSPPESTPAGFSTSSPENRNEPRTLRCSDSVRSGAAERMCDRTVRSVSRVSCSWA